MRFFILYILLFNAIQAMSIAILIASNHYPSTTVKKVGEAMLEFIFAIATAICAGVLLWGSN